MGIGIQSAYGSDSNVFVHKDISDTKFSWSEDVIITITIINIGSSNVTDLSIVDDIPLGFIAKLKDDGEIKNGRVVFSHTQAIKPGDEKSFSYILSAVKGMTSKDALVTLIPSAEITYVKSSNPTTVKTNQIEVTISSDDDFWNENIAVTVALLVTIAFVSGLSGTKIHNLNVQMAAKKDKPDPTIKPNTDSSPVKVLEKDKSATDNENKEKDKNVIDDENKEKEERSEFHVLMGGAAGIIILASFEGLSSLFSGEQLQFTVQNVIVLIATTLAAGFAPAAVIDRMTSKLKTEKTSAEKIVKVVETANTNLETKITKTEKDLKKEKETVLLVVETNTELTEKGKKDTEELNEIKLNTLVDILNKNDEKLSGGQQITPPKEFELGISASDVMNNVTSTDDLTRLDENKTAEAARKLFKKSERQRILVIENENPTHILKRSDLNNKSKNRTLKSLKKNLEQVSTISEDDDIGKISSEAKSITIVKDKSDKMTGIITSADIVKFAEKQRVIKLDDIKWEYFHVDQNEYTPTGNYPTLVKFSGKIKKGGLSGHRLYIDIKKENIEKEEETKHGLPDNGEFVVTYGVTVDSPKGEYIAVARYLKHTRYVKASDPVTFTVK